MALSIGKLSNVAQAVQCCDWDSWDGWSYVCNESYPVTGKYCNESTGQTEGNCSSIGAYFNPGADGQLTCTPCPAGSYCSNSNISGKCSGGDYSTMAAYSCSSCPAGDSCDDNAHAPVTCPAGTYSGSGDIHCYVVSAGSYGQAGTSTSISSSTSWSPQGASVAFALAAWEVQVSTSSPPIRCPDGYHTAGNTACTIATAGNFVPDAAAEQACPEGTYTDQDGLAACMFCPPGYDCTGKNQVSICSDGLYNPGGFTSCQDCPAGYSCEDKGGQPRLCDPGTGSGNAEMSCTRAADGSEMPNLYDSSPNTCTTGFYSVQRKWSDPHQCQPCPRGYSCTSTSALPEVCTAGQVEGTEQDSDGCETCPTDHMCPATDAVAYQCPYGHHTAGADNVEGLGGTLGVSATGSGVDGQSGCRKKISSIQYCTGGVGSTNPLNTELATTVGDQMYGWPNPGECILCPEGFMCPQSDQQPVPCPPGFYSAAGANRCTMCEPGYQCPTPYSTDRESCNDGKSSGINDTVQPDSTGWYSYGMQVVCYPAPPGMSIPDQSSRPEWCNREDYSRLGVPDCSICPTDYECEEHNLDPTPCAFDGDQDLQTRTALDNEGDEAIKTSLVNTGRSWAGEKRCYPAVGVEDADYPNNPWPQNDMSHWSANDSGMTPFTADMCERAALSLGLCAGSSCDGTGDFSSTTAPDGSTPPDGCYYYDNSLGSSYAGNAYWNSATDFATAASPAAALASDQIQIVDVVLDGYEYNGIGYDGNGEEGINNLYTVTPGTFGWKGFTTAADCPPGHQCMFPYQQSWIECPPGYYSKPYRFICEPCPEHYQCLNRGDDATTLMDGYWSPLGTHIQMVSPAGWYSKQEGVSTEDERMFRPCAVGYYSNDFASECSECDANFHCEHASSVPLRCPEGRESASTGNAFCDHCAKDQYIGTDWLCAAIPDGMTSLHPMYTAQPCLAGTYSDGTTTTTDGQEDCQACAAGFLCLHETTNDTGATTNNDSSNSDNVLPNGYWASSNTVNSGRYIGYACPAGTYASGTGTTWSDCLACPSGSYCEGGDGSTTCPAGHLCPQNSSATGGTRYPLEYPCLPGTILTSSGGSSLTACSACADGDFCLQGASVATACPPGYICPQSSTVTDQHTGSQDPYREACPGGTYRTASGGSVVGDCSSCGAGNYCPPGSVYPQKCPTGTYSSATDATYAWECDDIASGKFQSVPGTSSSSGSTCVDGFLCPGRVAYSNQLPCPPGTYGSCVTSGSPAFSDSPQCTAGYACPQGTGDVTTNGVRCEPGFYCPEGTLHPRQYPCPAGEYSGAWGNTQPSDCQDCEAGYYCPEGSYRMYDCPVGYYCPANTEYATEYPCPAGKYGADNSYADSPDRRPESFFGYKALGKNLQSDTDCAACPAGHYCYESYDSDPIPCPRGTYCTGDCTASSYEDSQDLWGDDTGCSPCDEGSYCPFEGMFEPLACGYGYYSPLGAQECTLCALGSRCDVAGDQSDILNSPGMTETNYLDSTYQEGGYETTLPDSTYIQSTVDCPLGYYCPPGSFGTDQVNTNAIPCPIGTYGATINLKALSECTDVNSVDTGDDLTNGQLGGHYADQPGTTIDMYNEQFCSPGYACPDNVACTSRYCQACPPGQYTQTEGTNACLPCPDGFYCPGSTPYVRDADLLDSSGAAVNTRSTFRPVLCPAGYYCATNPDGLDAAYGSIYPYLCPIGTYGGKAGLKLSSECTTCPAGNYCIEKGALSPTGLCDAGYLCLGGSTTPRPYGQGVSYDADTATSTIDGTPNYVDSAGVKKNEPGYDDATGAWDGADGGGICPAGGYCEIGSKEQLSCKGGYYNPDIGAKTVFECQKCYPGHYCAGEAQASMSGKCTAGYYCIQSDTEGGSSVADQYPAQPGTYTLSEEDGDPDSTYTPKEEVDCPIGTYNNFYGRGYCIPCHEGYYCPAAATSYGMVYCPTGAYCVSPQLCEGSTDGDIEDFSRRPLNDGTYEEWTPGCGAWVYELCPAGTYNPNTHQPTELQACLMCPPGKYCQTTGLEYPTGDCDPGHFCVQQASSRSPTTDTIANGMRFGQCPAGHYCESGTAYPAPCPAGTFLTTTLAEDVSECVDCTAGYFCEDTGISAITSDMVCQRGFFCLSGSHTAAPMTMPDATCTSNGGERVTVCPKGAYCPEGSDTPLSCPAGTYQPNAGQWACLPCPSGYYCALEDAYEDPTCDSANPETWGPYEPRICPVGHYCERTSDSVGEGQEFGQPCEAGKYQPEIGQARCVSCDAGYQCPSTGMEKPIDYCDAGYYCRQGNTNGTPSLQTNGGYCPTGYYCDTGAAHPRQCEPGYACPEDTRDVSVRVACAAGYYCLGATTSATPADLAAENGAICPAGHYCPQYSDDTWTTEFVQADYDAGTVATRGTKAPIPCAPGTYNPDSGSYLPDACLLCPDTMFCEGYGNTAATGCSDGWYCLGGETEPKPEGQICPIGFKCLSGDATPCEDGTYTDQIGQTGCVQCPAGYQCRVVNTVQIDFTGYSVTQDASTSVGADTLSVCGFNAYCPIGQNSKVACSDGYYTVNHISEAIEQCLLCPAGFVCNCDAVEVDDQCAQNFTPCSQGLYCPEGSYDEAQSPVVNCGDGYEGHFCPAQTPNPIPCRPGYACEGPTDYEMDDSMKCTEGYYCTGGSSTKTPTDGVMGDNCGYGNYCPEGSPAPTPCSLGTFNGDYTDANGVTANDNVGTINGADDTVCVTCPDSHSCDNRGTQTPSSSATCSAGYYCVAGNVTPCPAGAFCNTNNNQDADSPYLCGDTDNYGITGQYNPMMYQSECQWCPEGYYCPTPYNEAILCPAGYYCPGGTEYPIESDHPNYSSGGSTGNYAKPCASGTWTEALGTTASYRCWDCQEGHYCAQTAEVANTTPPLPVTVMDSSNECAAGEYCPAGSREPYDCTPGNYCPLGSSYEIACPVGYYNDDANASADTDCTECDVNKYCPTKGMTSTDANLCGDGYECILGAKSAAPWGGVEGQLCQAGQKCSRLIEGPQDCADETYNPDQGRSSCLYCPEGRLCQMTDFSGAATTYSTGVNIVDSTGSPVPRAEPSDCTAGYYCPAATATGDPVAVETICADGSYSFNPNLIDQDDCIPCPIGKYCIAADIEALIASSSWTGSSYEITDPSLLLTNSFPDCTAGYYCPMGSSVATGTDVEITGSDSEWDGEYDSSGVEISYIQDYTIGGTTGGSCPSGFFCKAGTSAPEPCPLGTYGLGRNYDAATLPLDADGVFLVDDAGDKVYCDYCKGGYYCDVVGLNEERLELYQKECDAGHWCANADNRLPNPNTDTVDTGVLCADGSGTGYDGLEVVGGCYPDKYDSAGTLVYASSCCGEPTGNIMVAYSGDLCPKGHYCPRGTETPILCDPGYYEPRVGSDECQLCPAGFYCTGEDPYAGITRTINGEVIDDTSAITPLECSFGYCPEGSSEPTLCPDGFYSTEETPRMAAEDECLYCPHSYYCSDGFLQGLCDAGYFCDYGASLRNDPSKLCAIGHYCPAGTDYPIRCDEGKYNAVTGATDVSYCTECLPGWYCMKNDSVMRICPKGHFCPEKSIYPTPCFKGTYNGEKGMDSSTDCLDCPKGSFCDDIGIDDYLRYPCPVGHYCDVPKQKKDPIKCPVGTYRNATGAYDKGVYENFLDRRVGNSTWENWTPDGRDEPCRNCTAGTYCPPASIYPVPCEAGYTCPNMTGQPYACEPGTFCGAMTGEFASQCPPGYFCEFYRTDIYEKCTNGTYCPEAARAETKCPAGYFGSGRTDNYDQDLGCIGCGRGTYSSDRTDSCELCDEGFTCEAYATTAQPRTPAEGGKVCPKGFYCPKGSFSAIACKVGTYNDQEQKGSENDCTPCPAGSFNQFVGGTKCFECKGSSISTGKSSTCQCRGLNRKYLAAEGSCICQTGYIPIDGTAEDTDGSGDCEKLVYPRCTPEQIRDTNGQCRDLDDCSNECDGGAGRMDQQFGICECDGLTDVESLVSRAELARRPKLSFQSDGKLNVYDPVSNDTYSVDPSQMPNVAGEAICPLEDPTECKLVPVQMLGGENGNFGSDMNPCPKALPKNEYERCIRNQSRSSRRYGGTRTYIRDGQISDQPIVSQPEVVTPPYAAPEDNLSDWGWDMGWNIAPDQGRNQRRLQEADDEIIDPNAGYITNPIVCINMGSALLFEDLNFEEKRYPVFDKDNLLNQNGDLFDESKFVELGQLEIEVNGQKYPGPLVSGEVDSYIHTFQTPGLFVFHDARNPSKQMVIAVMGDQKTCPDDLSFSPMNYASLLKIDAFRREVLEPPDWGFFFGVIMAFVGLIIITVIVVGYMFNRDWNQKWIPKVAYQMTNYEKAQNSNPEDRRAIVSINTEAGSFLTRSHGADLEAEEAAEEGLEAIMDADDGEARFAARKSHKKLKKKDLTLRDVEGLKDDLGSHLKEIKKLFRTERDFDESSEEQDLDSDEESSDAEYDRDLNTRIANVKKRLMHNANMLKGEADEEGETYEELGLGIDDDANRKGADDGKDELAAQQAKQDARDEAAARAKAKLRDDLVESEGKYLNELQLRQNDVNEDLERKRDRVLEMQVESAYARGQDFQDKLGKEGAQGDDLKVIMDELEAKMGHVEGILMADQDRQTEQLRKRLEMRAKRRRKMQNRLEDEHDRVVELQHEREDMKAEKLIEIQTELKEDLQAMDSELAKEQEALDQQYLVKKADKMSDYQDRLKAADGKDTFNEILAEYQRAQVGVDRELDKQKAKEADRLEQALAARKAKRRAQAQMKMKEESQKIDSQVDAEAAEHVENKAKIEASLKQAEEAAQKYGDYAQELNNRLDGDSAIHHEMERKRREEERLEAVHERERSQADNEAAKDIERDTAEVEAEIKKLSNLSTYQPFQEQVSKRDALQKQINGASSDAEKQALLRQLEEVDAAVKNNLNADAKDQDAKLQARLEARRKKKEKALAAQTELKKDQLEQRIKKSLENSEDFAQTRKEKSMKEIERLIREMQDNVPAAEIPAAVERMIDDRHQKELEDMLLKLYEQKAIQLKEEILAIMEEKLARQQMLRKQAEDRKRGIDAIISRTPDKKVTTDMIAKKAKLDEDLQKGLTALENEYRKKEGEVQREVQGKTMDREAEQIAIIQERQIEEKQEIFTRFLPDQMMTDIYDSMAAEERDELMAYQEELKKEKAAKLSEMEAAEAEHEKMLAGVSKDLERMKRLDQQAQQRERSGQKYKTTMRRREEAQTQSKDVVAEVKARYEKDLAGLSERHAEVRDEFLGELKTAMDERKAKVAAHKKAKAEEAARIAKEQADEQERHYMVVREARAKRAKLEKELEDRQRPIYKGMYSRQEPKWGTANPVLAAALEGDGNFDFDEKEQKVFAKRIYNELLEKITALEDQLGQDTTRLTDAARQQEIQRQREEELEGMDGQSVGGMSRQYSGAMSRAGSRYDMGMTRAGSIGGAAPSRQASRANSVRRQSLIKGLKARLGNVKF